MMDMDLVEAMEAGGFALMREGKTEVAVKLLAHALLERKTIANQTFLNTYGAEGEITPTSLDAWRTA